MDPVVWLRKHLEEADTDLLREMVHTFIQVLMGAEVDAICGAAYGERSPDRVNRRNGVRPRRFDTRAGTIDLGIPKLREGSYFPGWLLEPHRRAEQALVQVVAECYVKGVSTRRVDGVVRALGIEGISRSQVSEMAKSLDEAVAAFRSRPLDAGPYTYLWLDALSLKCREGGRIANVSAVVATSVNADGHREILGLDVLTTEDGAGWTAFLRDLVARGLSGVRLAISDDHAGLVGALAGCLPGASWQRCRTHFMRNILARVPGHRPARADVPRCGGAPCRGRARHHRVRLAPHGALAADLEQQPPGAVEPGDPPADRRGGDLPQPRGDHPPGRLGARRAARRVGRGPAVHEPRVPRQGPPDGGPRRASRRHGGGEPGAGGGRLIHHFDDDGASGLIHHLTGRGHPQLGIDGANIPYEVLPQERWLGCADTCQQGDLDSREFLSFGPRTSHRPSGLRAGGPIHGSQARNTRLAGCLGEPARKDGPDHLRAAWTPRTGPQRPFSHRLVGQWYREFLGTRVWSVNAEPVLICPSGCRDGRIATQNHW